VTPVTQQQSSGRSDSKCQCSQDQGRGVNGILYQQPYLKGWRIETRSRDEEIDAPDAPPLLCRTESRGRLDAPLRCGYDVVGIVLHTRLRTSRTLKSEYSCHRNHLRGALPVTSHRQLLRRPSEGAQFSRQPSVQYELIASPPNMVIVGIMTL
jgi:hypothetical protein